MTTFEVWAPRARTVRIHTTADDHDCTGGGDGWWRADLPSLAAGTDYTFLLGDDETPIPDPRSRWQPEGVHGPSRVYDQDAYEWSDQQWTGRPLAGGVVYELHVGTFTDEGTFDAVLDKLDHLVELGVDFVELLPVNAVNGTHNWGYDGVGWYAVHDPYGGPDGLKRLVDGCHQRGLGVLLDVVYNHLGPSGNYLDRFGPYFTESRNPANPWGASLNLDGPDSDPVRRHIIDNALMWLRDYHLDGLRLDAVHALVDHRALHLLEQLAVEVDGLSTHLERPLTLIAESDLNDPKLITPREAGGYGLTAQWNDDFHHALHTALTGERQGYYADFGSLATLATTLREAFFHAGTWSSFRRRLHGRPVDTQHTSGWRFLGYLQNHDQIGNRATGDRISATLSPGLVKVGAALVLTAPFTPMLFQGEEWAASTPWQFFTSHPEKELGEIVARGRVEEFLGHGWAGAVPDPQDPQTFADSKLPWNELAEPDHADTLDFYQRLIGLRRDRPELTDPRLTDVRVRFDEEARWLVLLRGRVAVVCNLAAERQTVPIGSTPVEMLLASAPGFVYAGEEVELDGESTAIVALPNA
ncbi:MAG TPA: malto-oligosyltrehalose trehalohydrolase [Mycobacteriales bacterium]|jgi:maltooligosyltrehalose trehalohydrolase|nr:malto-oligosyltrehalose trehalohydrolase [Mycobacteriales bacterium]